MQALQGTVFFLFILACVSATPNPKNHPRDLSALLAFKSRITSDPHNILTTTWNPNTSFCTWTGVNCSRRRPRVTALQLDSLSLAGTIAPEIGNLSFLSSLNLSKNAFTGHLPNSLGSLRRLKFLSLSNNILDGPIPPSIFNVSSIEGVRLSGNLLSGEIPPVHLPRLRILSLSRNNLDGPIPPTIFNIPSLEKLSLAENSLTGEILPIHLPRLNFLNLGNNHLSGEIPSSIGNLTQLKQLGLGYNEFRAKPMPKAILNMSSLVMIGLSLAGLYGTFPTDFGLHFPFLQALYLARNDFSGPIPGSLSNASNLVVLEISGNMFTGSVPVSLGDLPLLQKLDLADNRLSGGLEFLSSLLHLNYFEVVLSDNSFNGSLPDLHLSNISTSLQLMVARDCSITGSISMLSNLSSLINLDLSYNELSGTIPSEFKNLEKMQELHLTGNRLEGSIPQEIFQSMINLGTLSLDQNLLSGPISSYVGNLTRLQKVTLAENALSSTIPSSIWGLAQLISLDLSHNLLEGYLPVEVGNLNFLALMNLSSNRLSGFLPSTLGHLPMLVNLNLHNNSFSGAIPQSLSNLKSLNLLDLSSNSLSGEIPKSLANLQYLTSLNLSFNRLEGEVPDGGAFANLTMQSLIGNLALCGSTKQGLPTCKASNTKTSRAGSIMLKYVLPFLLFGFAVFIIMFNALLSNKKQKSRGRNPIKPLPSLVHQRFVSERELVRATNNFNETNILGVGNFGSVYKGILEDGMIVAIKVLKLGSSEQAPKRFEKECEVMCNIRHRNLVKIISVCSTENFKAFILQYMPNNSLDKWLHSSQDHKLSILERMCIVSDVASALEYLHHGCSRPVVHSDVKPSNILLDENMVGHLGDFGISKLLSGDKSVTPTSTLGTLGYVAPEYGLFGKSSIQGDIYSFGILLLETFTGRKPTDAMFTSGSSIRQWVEESFPHGILKIVDGNLLINGDETHSDDGDNIELGDAQTKHKCLSSVLELGMICSSEMPKERMTMKDVVVRLNKIKMELVSVA